MTIRWVAKPVFELIENEGNWDKFITVREGIVVVNDEIIRFPIGWVTDITSSPLWARGFVGQLGPHSPAALIHDRLLETGHSRKYSRQVMKKQLDLLEKVGKLTKWWMFCGVWVYDVFSKTK